MFVAAVVAVFIKIIIIYFDIIWLLIKSIAGGRRFAALRFEETAKASVT